MPEEIRDKITLSDKAKVERVTFYEFENWLKTVCFQKPTSEAYDLAWAAWQESEKQINMLQYNHSEEYGFFID